MDIGATIVQRVVMSKTIGRRLRVVKQILASLLLGAILVFALNAANAQSSQTISPEGYVDLAGIWPSPSNITVCWEPAAERYDQEKAWVQDTVSQFIVGNSSVRFANWNECAPASMGIRINIVDEWPRSEVGHQWVRDPKNPHIIVQDVATARPLELPTHMFLNFTFSKQFAECAADREHCIRAISLHEMLHALGFLHEQLRSDTPPACKDRYKSMNDFGGISPLEVTAHYDSDSHMNYCANMYRKPIRLSEGDIQVLKALYTSQ